MQTIRLIMLGLMMILEPAMAASPGIVQLSDPETTSGKTFLGFILSEDGYLVATGSAVKGVSFVKLQDGSEYSARFVAKEAYTGLVLLKIATQGDKLLPVTLAKDAPEVGRKVTAAKPDGRSVAMVAGSLGNIKSSKRADRPPIYLHNALVGSGGLGSPLLNNCGEATGVVIKEPGVFGGLFNSSPEAKDSAFAVPIDWLLKQFSDASITIVTAKETCLSEEEQAAKAEALAKAKEEEALSQAEKAKQETEKAKAEAEKAKAAEEKAKSAEAQAKSATEAAQQAKEEATEAAQQAKEEATEAAQQAKEEADAAAVELEALEEKLKQTKDASIAEQEAMKQSIEAAKQSLADMQAKEIALAEKKAKDEQLYLQLAIGAGILVLIVLLMFWLMRRRALRRVQAEKAEAELQASEAHAHLASQQAEEERRAATPSVFIEGQSSDGQQLALRIPGTSIAVSGGVTVGRNPGDSDFVINDPEVSRCHFRISAQEGSLLVDDLGSTNGTRVDGNTTYQGHPAMLQQSSRLALGELVLSVRLE